VSPSTRVPRFLVAGATVIAAGVAGFLFYRVGAPAPAPTLTPEPVTAPAGGEEAPAPSAAPAGRKVPETLPEITLADLSGKPTRLARYGGRPLLVNFWATWCAPCRREIPLLNRLHAQRQGQNAEIVGIAVDFKDEVVKFVQKVPIRYPLLVGEEDGLAAAEAFGMGMAFPFSVFIDSQNRILTVKVGELHEDEANFAFDRLRDLDTGALTLQQAQWRVAEAFQAMAAARAVAEAKDANSAQ
jgi:thiol-disulfide isomerase/thioredoxin